MVDQQGRTGDSPVTTPATTSNPASSQQEAKPLTSKEQRIALAHQLLPVPVQHSVPSLPSTRNPSLQTATPTIHSNPMDEDGKQIPDLHRVPFGSRLLQNPDDVFSHNAWDHVVPPPEWENDVRARLEFQRGEKVSEEKKENFNARPAYFWDKFYLYNKANFFKDRNWLRLEFTELLECAKADAGPKKVVEIGCGAGNTVFPLLTNNENPDLQVWACDYSKRAVEVVKENPLYPVPPHGKGRLHSSVWDLSTPPSPSQNLRDPSLSTPPAEGEAASSLPEGIEPESVDIAIMIFVMSALHPMEWQRAIANVWKMLKPNGMVFIRDYGRYDLAQLRIKKGRMLGENFYVRGDGTRVYFFEAAELSELLTGSKDAYIPTEPTSTTVDIEAEEGAAASEPIAATDVTKDRQMARLIATASDSPMPGTPDEEFGPEGSAAPTAEKVLDGATAGLGQLQIEKKEREADEGETMIEERSGVIYKKGQPLSTRFTTPTAADSPSTIPRSEFFAHETPTVEGAVPATAGEGAPEEGEYDPFAGSHADLGIPEHALFTIDQLGVDRRMLVNRKEQLKMYRIWMQVKARKLVPESSEGTKTAL